eukprot:365565-Chlamydomonas_euryale.AAC.12
MDGPAPTASQGRTWPNKQGDASNQPSVVHPEHCTKNTIRNIAHVSLRLAHGRGAFPVQQPASIHQSTIHPLVRDEEAAEPPKHPIPLLTPRPNPSARSPGTAPHAALPPTPDPRPFPRPYRTIVRLAAGNICLSFTSRAATS